jgi:poly-beta-1,6-N-acetyl-D-glucosamine synthase
MSQRSYSIITPARNEAEFLQKTISSVTSQTVVPACWIIVDDGSTDATAEIIDKASEEYPWIRAIHRGDRGFRKSGGGVVETFYDGYSAVGDCPWEYLVKLDGDLSFERDYFERCLNRFEADSSLGIGGGTICGLVDGNLVEESKGDPRFHVRGATKIYRRVCWNAIGGLIKAPGWDTLDELKANMLGWKTYTFPELKLNHHRMAGGADGAWKNWVKNGRANYITGYHPLFMLFKCAQRLVKQPYFVAGLGLLSGFVGGYIQRVPQVQDEPLMKYLRRQQLNRLLMKPSLWDTPMPPTGRVNPDQGR